MKKSFLFKIVLLGSFFYLMSCAPTVKMAYKPNPINGKKLEIPVSTQVNIKNTDVSAIAKKTFTEEAITKVLIEDFNELFTNHGPIPEYPHDLNLKVTVNDIAYKAQPWGLIWFPLMFVGAPIVRDVGKSDISVSLTSPIDNSVVKQYNSSKKVAKWVGLFYGHKYENLAKPAFVTYLAMNHSIDEIKTNILKDRQEFDKYRLTKNPESFDEFIVEFLNPDKNTTSLPDGNKNSTAGNATNTNKGKVVRKFDPKTKSFQYTINFDNETDQIRKDWEKKGGVIGMTSINAGYNFMQTTGDGYKVTGNGGGFNLTGNWISLKMPDIESSVHNWSSFVGGISGGFIYNSATTAYSSGTNTEELAFNTVLVSLGANLGYTLGLGRYLSPDNWKGVALAFTYRPSIGLSQVFISGMEEESEPTFVYNLVGFGVDFNFSNFHSSLERIAPKAGSKIGFFFLPQTEKTPLMFNVTYGLVFYNKK